MPAVNIRTLMHNFSHYLDEVKSGDAITILERNNPVAELIPHNKHIRYPGWKRTIQRRTVHGGPLSETIRKIRDEG